MTSPAVNAEITPLQERLIDLIKTNGPISIADYMTDALGHPHEGYYMSSSPVGAEGDFITAPEISQIFGELIGLWLVQSWTDMGSPPAFNLVEIGPGRGALMADILRAARLRPEFVNAATIWLVETSGRLRHEQQRRLRTESAAIQWADAFSDVAPGPTLLVANELFDCLPIRQFIRTKTSWRERLVGLADDDQALAFTIDKTPAHPSLILPSVEETTAGDIFEICEGGQALTTEIAQYLIENSGRALIIDYGHLASGFGDTLQAVRDHAYWPPLSSPGRADITAHIDFEALGRAAFEAGAAVYGPITQGAFLERLGLSLRVERLCKTISPAEAHEIKQSAHRISAPSQMGEIFKAFCLSSPDLPAPAGFEGE